MTAAVNALLNGLFGCSQRSVLRLQTFGSQFAGTGRNGSERSASCLDESLVKICEIIVHLSIY